MGELTGRSSHGGCACKISPERLDEVLDAEDTRALRRTGDAVAFDAGTSRLVGSVDFGTPLVDDPAIWAEISLANALSDVYAVGGTPVLAMAILGWPNGMGTVMAREAMAAATVRLRSLGIVLGGGHTIASSEPFLGFAVIGAEGERPMGLAGFASGDALILTQPLGTGVVMSAIKSGTPVGVESERSAVEAMRGLNNVASQYAQQGGVVGATDVSGYGLLGACWDLARASSVGVSISRSAVPVLPGVLDLINSGALPARAEETWRWLDRSGAFGDSHRHAADEMALCGPETSGGLLLGVPETMLGSLLSRLSSAGIPAATVGALHAGSPSVRLTT